MSQGNVGRKSETVFDKLGRIQNAAPTFEEGFEAYTDINDPDFIAQWYKKPWNGAGGGSESATISSDLGDKSLKTTVVSGSNSAWSQIYDHNASIYTNFSLVFDLNAMSISGGDSAREPLWGIDFRIQPNGEDCYRFLFRYKTYLSDTPFLRLYRVLGGRHYGIGQKYLISSAPWAPSFPISYKVNLTCIGPNIAICLNDSATPVISKNDLNYTSGYIGTYREAGDGTYSGAFTSLGYYDDVSVSTYTGVPTITHPADISYNLGMTGNQISWTITDASTGTRSYTIYRDGSSIASGSWTSGTPVTKNVDGLAAGSYNYTIVAADGLGGSVQDTVIVNVLDVPSTIAADNYTLMLVILGSVGIIVTFTRKQKY
jgi:hypothetical protein